MTDCSVGHDSDSEVLPALLEALAHAATCFPPRDVAWQSVKVAVIASFPPDILECSHTLQSSSPAVYVELGWGGGEGGGGGGFIFHRYKV